jgi:hypothetical protein
MVYGYDTEEDDDPLIKVFHTGLTYLEDVTAPENPLSIFPWCKSSPNPFDKFYRCLIYVFDSETYSLVGSFR